MSAIMSAKEFLANVEGANVPVPSHEDVLRVSFIYLDDYLMSGNGVFDVVEKLHAHGWSFGKGELHFNRTLDIFYISQVAAAIYRYSSQMDGDYPSFSDFPALYVANHTLLHSSAWYSYYSTRFLTQHTTACFYRPPNLQDLPDSSSPLCMPQPNPVSTDILRLPRWAYTVANRWYRQPSLPLISITAIALTTLETVMSRLQMADSKEPSYSESDARFWLDYFLPNESPSNLNEVPPQDICQPYRFGMYVAQGKYDIHGLEAKYLSQVSEGKVIKGEGNSAVMWTGWPDGATGYYAWCRGWEEEIGSEEVVEFLATIAVEETAGLGLKGMNINELDLSVQSHIFLAVLQAAVKNGKEKEDFLTEMEMQMVQKRMITEERVGRWVREAVAIMEPYVSIWQGVWPSTEEKGKMLKRILVENAQLFGCWKVSPVLKEFTFELGLGE